MKRRPSFSSLLLSAALLLLGAGLTGCNERPDFIERVEIHTDTSLERKETMAELRAAWRSRTSPADEYGKRAELRFLVRLANTVRKYEDTESYTDFCNLWNQCLKEHLARFPDSTG